MILSTTFDPSRRLDFYFRVKRAGSKTLVFIDSSGNPIDVSDFGFQFIVKEYQGARTNAFILSEGSGLTVGGAGNNELEISPTVANTSVKEGEYYVELYKSSTNKTYLNGIGYLHNGLFDGVNNSAETITISDTEDITITINDTVSVVKSIDFELSSAQILDLHNTPIQYIAPISSTKYPVPISCEYIYNFGGTPYTRNSSASIIHTYNAVTSAGITSIGNILTQSFNAISRAVVAGAAPVDVDQSLMLNQGMYVSLNAGSFTLGNGTLKIKVLYHVVTI